MSVKTIDVKANSVEDAFDQAGLNWIAEQSEMINSANSKVIENKKVIYRGDNNHQLGVVGTKFGVIQNSDCFSFFDIICNKYNANICKVSEYNGGGAIHLEAEVRDKKFNVKVGDEVGMKFSLWNGFDGLHKASVKYGALRLVCSNGLVAFGKDAKMIEIRHTLNAVDRMEKAIQVWAGAENWFKKFKEGVMILNNKMVDKKIAEKFIESLFPGADKGVTLRKKEKVFELFESGKGNNGQTAWDLVNGLTEWVDHYSKKDNNEMFEYANDGEGYNLKSKAFHLAMKI